MGIKFPITAQKYAVVIDSSKYNMAIGIAPRSSNIGSMATAMVLASGVVNRFKIYVLNP